jgi:hypothetical protein
MKMQNEQKIDECMEIINMVSHSPTRVPYTYHHDYVRMNVNYKLSRADVAKLKPDEVDCYILSACYVIENKFTAKGILNLDDRKRDLCKGITQEGEFVLEKTKIKIGEIYGE